MSTVCRYLSPLRVQHTHTRFLSVKPLQSFFPAKLATVSVNELALLRTATQPHRALGYVAVIANVEVFGVLLSNLSFKSKEEADIVVIT